MIPEQYRKAGHGVIKVPVKHAKNHCQEIMSWPWNGSIPEQGRRIHAFTIVPAGTCFIKYLDVHVQWRDDDIPAVSSTRFSVNLHVLVMVTASCMVPRGPDRHLYQTIDWIPARRGGMTTPDACIAREPRSLHLRRRPAFPSKLIPSDIPPFHFITIPPPPRIQPPTMLARIVLTRYLPRRPRCPARWVIRGCRIMWKRCALSRHSTTFSWPRPIVADDLLPPSTIPAILHARSSCHAMITIHFSWPCMGSGGLVPPIGRGHPTDDPPPMAILPPISQL